jgi:hypothetical protein
VFILLIKVTTEQQADKDLRTTVLQTPFFILKLAKDLKGETQLIGIKLGFLLAGANLFCFVFGLLEFLVLIFVENIFLELFIVLYCQTVFFSIALVALFLSISSLLFFTFSSLPFSANGNHRENCFCFLGFVTEASRYNSSADVIQQEVFSSSFPGEIL